MCLIRCLLADGVPTVLFSPTVVCIVGCACVCMVHACTCIWGYVCLCMGICVYECMCVYIWMCIYVLGCMYRCVYVYMHMCMVCVCVCGHDCLHRGSQALLFVLELVSLFVCDTKSVMFCK